jgi:hypothetical protein
MTKDEIITALDDTRREFLAAIAGLSDEQLQEPGVNGDWTVKDIMHHISLWEAETVTLLFQTASGQTPSTVHFTQQHFDQTNAAWYAQGQSRLLQDIRQDFEGVRRQTRRRLDDFSEEELNNPQRASWQRDHPLWEWIGSDSFQHEPEHTAQILAWRKARGY